MPYAISPSIQRFVSPPTLVFFMFNATFLVSLLYIWGIYLQAPVLYSTPPSLSPYLYIAHSFARHLVTNLCIVNRVCSRA